MVVRFTCPKGHGISANDSMVGKSGKCPQCGATFVVPTSSPSGNMNEIIVFLCPNGHKLNGPKSMQGKPGKCPHCGSRFQVPVYDEEELAAAAAGSGPQPPLFNQADRVQELGRDSTIGAGDQADTEPAAPIELPTDAHSLAKAFGQLWTYLSDGPIDVQLRDGQTLRIDSISLPLSQGTHAVFAQDLPDGVRAVATPWDSVAKIVFPKFDRFPEDLFL